MFSACRTLLLSTACLALAACSSNSINKTDLSSLSELNKDSFHVSAGINSLRYSALRDTALSLGARAGLAHRAAQLNEMMNKKARYLDRIFNFHAIMLDDNVLPPVLTEAKTTLDQPDDSTIHLSDRTLTITAQAQFVTMPPTWRDYLWLRFKEPELPDSSLLPKSDDEQEMWKRYIHQGWLAGIEQADSIYAENLAKLKQSYQGMLLYRKLLAQRIVSPPFVAKTHLGVTGNGSELNVNDRILRITALPSLQSNSNAWKTEITPHENRK